MRTFECKPPNLLPHVVIETNPKVTAAVLWLHGLGADGYDFAGLPRTLNLTQEKGYRYLFPHALHRPISLNGGIRMRAWYDVDTLESFTLKDTEGMRSSALAITQLIEDQITRGIPACKIILGGFSQGGSVALYVGLTYKEALGGIVGLSTYLPSLGQRSEETVLSSQKSSPIFMAHGTRDEIVPYEAGHKSMQNLKQQGHVITWQAYDIGHEVCDPEMKDLSTWLDLTLNHE